MNLHSIELTRRYDDQGLTSFSLHVSRATKFTVTAAVFTNANGIANGMIARGYLDWLATGMHLSGPHPNLLTLNGHWEQNRLLISRSTGQRNISSQ